MLLEYTNHEEEVVRSPAIRLVANQLYPLQALTESVLEYAFSMLQSLVSTNPPEDNKLDEGKADKLKEDTEMTEDAPEKSTGARDVSEAVIQRKLFLYFALCTKKHELLNK